jgi:hypothetical protein
MAVVAEDQVSLEAEGEIAGRSAPGTNTEPAANAATAPLATGRCDTTRCHLTLKGSSATAQRSR